MKKNGKHYGIIFLRLLRKAALLINIAACVWLLLCFMASIWDVGDKPSYLSLLSFSNVFAVFANIFCMAFWLFSKKKLYLLFSLISLGISYPIVKASFGFNLFNTERAENTELGLKVMTWNVHLFDLGEWTQNKQSKNKIVEFIERQDPDIVCLQEFYFDNDNPNEPYTEIFRNMGYAYHEFGYEDQAFKRHLNISAKKGEIITVGNMIFSKFPLSNAKVYHIDSASKNYVLLGVDVALSDERKLRLFTTHLQSVTFDDKDVALAEERTQTFSTSLDSEAKGLLKKLMMASSKRARQANAINAITSSSDLPVIICGDFNDMPGSYVYTKIKGSLADAFSSNGLGLGRTYRKIFPTLRIDYMLYDAQALNCRAYRSPNLSLSDHNPVIATFSLKEKNSPTSK